MKTHILKLICCISLIIILVISFASCGKIKEFLNKYQSDENEDNNSNDNTQDTHEHTYENDVCTVCGREKVSDGLKFILSGDGTYYIFSGLGTCTDSKIVIPSEYAGLPVKEIAENIITSNNNIRNVIIPDSITSVGKYAFDACHSLEYNEHDNGLYLGSKSNPYSVLIKVKNTDLTSFKINNATKVICDSAFDYYNHITSIDVSDSIITVSNVTFEKCTDILYNEYGNGLYLGNESNPYSVLVKAKNTDIISLEIHADTKVISGGAFEYCTNLASVEIPNGVISIGDFAFFYCTALTNIEIPNSITIIGNSAFSNCTNIANIVIPGNVTLIEKDAFSNCGNLQNITVDQNNSTYISKEGSLYSKSGKNLVRYVLKKTDTKIVIPADVTMIGASAFKGYRSIVSIVIPNSVEIIGDSAFSDCSSLVNIELSSNLKTLGHEAFSGCIRLVSLVFLNGLTSIGDNAFKDCTHLAKIIIPVSVKSIGKDAFHGCSALEIYYEGKRDEWKKFSPMGNTYGFIGKKVYFYSSYEPTESGNFWYYNENEDIVVW